MPLSPDSRATWKALNLRARQRLALLFRSKRLYVVEEHSRRDLRLRRYLAATGGFPLLVLHGATLRGYNDYPVVRYCKQLAAVGFHVYSPNLPGLSSLQADPHDLEIVREVMQVAALRNDRQIGVLGLDIGGAYGVLAASHPEVAANVRFVMADGFCSLENFVQRAAAAATEQQVRTAFPLLALDWKFRDHLPLSDQERLAYSRLMTRFNFHERRYSRKEKKLIRAILALPEQQEVLRQWKKEVSSCGTLCIEENPTLAALEAELLFLHKKRHTCVPAVESLHGVDLLRGADRAVHAHIEADEQTDLPALDREGIYPLYRRMLLLALTADRCHRDLLPQEEIIKYTGSLFKVISKRPVRKET